MILASTCFENASNKAASTSAEALLKWWYSVPRATSASTRSIAVVISEGGCIFKSRSQALISPCRTAAPRILFSLARSTRWVGVFFAFFLDGVVYSICIGVVKREYRSRRRVYLKGEYSEMDMFWGLFNLTYGFDCLDLSGFSPRVPSFAGGGFS